MVLHFDKDESYHRKSGAFIHPTFSSVLYLSDLGGPTLILPQTISSDGANLSSGHVGSAYASEVTANSLLVFPGHLRHGVVPDTRATDSWRTSLLLNWWVRRPSRPGCRTGPSHLGERIVETFSSHSPKKSELKIKSLQDLGYPAV